jgi:hypothetical protein
MMAERGETESEDLTKVRGNAEMIARGASTPKEKTRKLAILEAPLRKSIGQSTRVALVIRGC